MIQGGMEGWREREKEKKRKNTMDNGNDLSFGTNSLLQFWEKDSK